MKYKIGDIVKVINKLTKDRGDYYKYFSEGMDEYLGQIIEIEEIKNDAYKAKGWYWSDEMFEGKEENMFKKDDLENGDIVTLRNGDKLRVYGDNEFSQEQEEYDNSVDGFYDFDERLNHTYGGGTKDYDIVKVERPIKYETMFERKEEIKELTVSEISKILGYDVKIVKE